MLYANFYEKLKKKHVVISDNIKIADYFSDHPEYNVHVVDIDYTSDYVPCLFEFTYEIKQLHEIYYIIDGYLEDGVCTGQGYYLGAPRWVGEVINEFYDEDFIIEFNGKYCNIYKKKNMLMNYAQRCVIMHEIKKLEYKMAKIDAIWEQRGVTDATSEPEWEYYERMLSARVELGLGIE